MPGILRNAPLMVVSVLALSCGGSEERVPPLAACDLALVGGTIHSMDAAHPNPDVLVVDHGRVVALGGEELLHRFAPRRTLDLAGHAVVPGLIDAHAHFFGLGRQAEEVDLRGCTSYAEVIERVRPSVAGRSIRLARGEFVLGRGWNQELWPDEKMPTHDALSAISPDNPVLLRRVDGHATLANANAMALAGITAATAAPEGGEILKDAAGRPTGVFIDTAADLLPHPPEPTAEQRERWALRAQERCLAAGLTGLHDAGMGEEDLHLLEGLADSGRLRLRMNVMLLGDFDASDAPAPWLAKRLAAGPVTLGHDGHLSIHAVKLYLDGALGSRGAALLEPYADRPASKGLMQLSREAFVARVRACRVAGFQVATHAIGDAANRLALDAYEEVLGAGAGSDHRFRVEHAQVISLEDIPRFAKLGVIASMQPTHATSDMNMAEERIGPERLRGAYAWRSLLASGARLALGSDFPVESENPLWGIYAAITRCDHEGQPPGGWHAEEALTPEEALRGFTLDAAFAGFDEKELGSLSPGKRADFVILPEDPLTCPPQHLVGMAPVATWIGGVQAWPAEAAP
jgi:predicted amidohydrolase YtcJ